MDDNELKQVEELEALAGELSDDTDESSDEELFSNYTQEFAPSQPKEIIVNVDSVVVDGKTVANITNTVNVDENIPSDQEKVGLETLDLDVDTGQADNISSSSDEELFHERKIVNKDVIGDESMPTFDNLLDMKPSTSKVASTNITPDNSVNMSFTDLFTNIESSNADSVLETMKSVQKLEAETEGSDYDENADEDFEFDNEQNSKANIRDIDDGNEGPLNAEDSDSSSSDEDEYNEDFETANEFADDYLDHLANFLANLQAQLKRNQDRQIQIDTEITDLDNSRQSKIFNVDKSHVSITRRTLTIFGYPYFKDRDIFYPPPNQDRKTKERNEELDVWIDTPRPFIKEEKKRLREYVRENTIAIRLRGAEDQKEHLFHKIREFGVPDEEKEPVKRKLEEIEAKIMAVHAMSDDELFADAKEKIDWERISVKGFDSTHTPKECELQWKNLVHPSINRSVWCPEEDVLLKKLAEATNFQDWDAIAYELATGRTAHQCFVRFMTRHNVPCNNRKWLRSEDRRLLRLIATTRINHFIPWGKVSYYMDRRTRDQCAQRYIYSLKDTIARGSWLPQEDMLLLLGRQLYGKDWIKINELVVRRTPVQLHCRFNGFFSCQFTPWTKEEDHCLLETVRVVGLRDWVTVAHMLKEKYNYDRNRSQTRARFQIIYKTFKEDPSVALENMFYSQQPTTNQRKQEGLYLEFKETYAEWAEKQDPGETYQMTRYDGFGDVRVNEDILVKNCHLNKFIRYLQSFLPEPEPPAPLAPLEQPKLRSVVRDTEDEIYRKPLLPKKSSIYRGLKPHKFKKDRGRPWRPMPEENKYRLGRHFKSLMDRQIAYFFRPTWTMRQHHLRASYSETELELYTVSCRSLSNLLDLSRLDWRRELELSRKASQLFGVFREHCAASANLSLGAVGGYPMRSPVCLPVGTRAPRTYGRARQEGDRNTPVFQVAQSPLDLSLSDAPIAKDVLDLVPPSQATVLGLRGVLLRNEYLKSTERVSENIRAERDFVDKVVNEGINHHSIAEDAEFQETREIPPRKKRKICWEEADKRLVKRFIQLFFWPAKMSTIDTLKPEKVFEDTSGDEERTDDEVMDEATMSGSTICSAVLRPTDIPEAKRPIIVFDASPSQRKRGLGLQKIPRQKFKCDV